MKGDEAWREMWTRPYETPSPTIDVDGDGTVEIAAIRTAMAWKVVETHRIGRNRPKRKPARSAPLPLGEVLQ
jgi:hypothetical protein